tara:strand:+ start:2424 stop:3350 length:927 start_codon:yes stop_codon:yes gene_type:complete
MRSFNQSTDLSEKRSYLQHFIDWSETTHNAYYIRGSISSQVFYDVLSNNGMRVLNDFSRIIDNFLRVDRSKKELFCKIGPMYVHADGDPDLLALYKLFKIYWLTQDINRQGKITAPVQMLSFGYPAINCHPGSDKSYAIMFLAEPLDELPFVYIDYAQVNYKFYKDWDYEICDTAEKIEACFPNFTHPSFHTVYEWMELWRNDCNPHNMPVFNGIRKYHKKLNTWGENRFKIAVWHLSYFDAIHREGMLNDIDMLWDIKLIDDNTLLIGEHRLTKEYGIWRPDNGNFNAIYNPVSPIDKYTPYSSHWF